MKKKVWKIVLIIIIVLVIVVVIGFGYLYFNGMSGMSNNSKPKEGQIKVACVGDSITYGHGVSNWPSNNYPAVLQKLLGDEYHVANFGSSGSCVNPDGDQPYVERNVYHESMEYEPDILIFMLGTNDSKPENWVDIEKFIRDYWDLWGGYVDSEHQPEIYLCLCSEAYFIEENESGIAEYDIQPAVVDEISEAIGIYAALSSYWINVIDIHSLTEAHPEWYETDGIHPNADGAKAIAEAVADAILQKK